MRSFLVLLCLVISGVGHADDEQKLRILDAGTDGTLTAGLMYRAMINGFDDVSLKKAGPEDALKALEQGHAEILFLSDPGELPPELQSALWYARSCAVMVHKDNPSVNISCAMLSDAFSGRISRWQPINGSSFFLQLCAVKGNACCNIFSEKIMKDLSFDKKIYWASSSAEAAALAGGNRSILAVADFCEQWPKDVKYLQVDNVEPTSKSIFSATYPLAKRIFIVSRRKSDPRTRELIAFLLSRNMRSFLLARNCLPCPADKK